VYAKPFTSDGIYGELTSNVLFQSILLHTIPNLQKSIASDLVLLLLASTATAAAIAGDYQAA